MKKLIAGILVVVMCVFTLTACGAGDSVVGTWKGEIGKEDLMSAVTKSDSASETSSDMLELFSDIDITSSVTYTITFNEDGTGKEKVDTDSFESFTTDLLDAIIAKLNDKDFMIRLLAATSGNTEEEVSDMIDSALESQGMSYEDFVELMKSSVESSFDFDSLISSSDFDSDIDITYEYADGKLSIDDGEKGLFGSKFFGEKYDKTTQIPVSFSGDTMTLTVSNGELKLKKAA